MHIVWLYTVFIQICHHTGVCEVTFVDTLRFSTALRTLNRLTFEDNPCLLERRGHAFPKWPEQIYLSLEFSGAKFFCFQNFFVGALRVVKKR